jgi:hypothetical protein
MTMTVNNPRAYFPDDSEMIDDRQCFDGDDDEQ